MDDETMLVLCDPIPINPTECVAHLSRTSAATTRKLTDDALADDPIIAHAERFDPAGMDAYRRIALYAKAHRCTFQQALNDLQT